MCTEQRAVHLPGRAGLPRAALRSQEGATRALGRKSRSYSVLWHWTHVNKTRLNKELTQGLECVKGQQTGPHPEQAQCVPSTLGTYQGRCWGRQAAA